MVWLRAGFDRRPTALLQQRDGPDLNLRAWLDLAGRPKSDQRYIDEAHAAAESAAWQMARTEATTTEGAAEFLAYITVGSITGLFELGETGWHETAFRTVTTALAKISGMSRYPLIRLQRELPGHAAGFLTIRRQPGPATVSECLRSEQCRAWYR